MRRMLRGAHVTTVDDAIDAPCDNGLAVDVQRYLEAERNLEQEKHVYAQAVAQRRAAILILRNVHDWDNKRIGNLSGKTPGAIYRAINPRRGKGTEPDGGKVTAA